MTEADVLHWIKDTSLGAAVRQSRWMFAAGETLHFIGLSMMVGGLLVVDLRLIGFIRRIPIRSALAFLPFVLVGFVINLLTGIEFFAADPLMYWPSPAFKLKMSLILLAGLNALLFTVMAHRRVLALGPDEDTDTFTKVTAGLSLALWLGVILLGRLLPAFEGSTSFF
jgi:energy-coupling factor transporter transmembrane protein EcfT